MQIKCPFGISNPLLCIMKHQIDTSVVILGSIIIEITWAPWSLISPTSRQIVQTGIKNTNKVTLQCRIARPLWVESIGDQWISLQVTYHQNDVLIKLDLPTLDMYGELLCIGIPRWLTQIYIRTNLTGEWYWSLACFWNQIWRVIISNKYCCLVLLLIVFICGYCSQLERTNIAIYKNVCLCFSDI